MLPVAVLISFQNLKSKVVIEAIFTIKVNVSLALPCSCWIQALVYVYSLQKPLRALFAVCGKLRCLRKVLKTPLEVKSYFDWLQWCWRRVAKTEIVISVWREAELHQIAHIGWVGGALSCASSGAPRGWMSLGEVGDTFLSVQLTWTNDHTIKAGYRQGICN